MDLRGRCVAATLSALRLSCSIARSALHPFQVVDFHCLYTHFVSSDYTRALQLDELKSSHPIEVCLALHSFPLLSCSPFQPFQDGMKAYSEKFKCSNATTKDLWTVLQATSGCDVTEFMPLWTKQTGYPVVSVRLIRAPGGK
ncbi:unnamed protein product [Taenia asiatica]|uniref:FBA_2 domain-containing protein n=1 Tax=Taenia asiatica TaxID=60517 RepID=A0A0R3WG00_TAEAS|nr:unnamed protein product [Taenia asiatica]